MKEFIKCMLGLLLLAVVCSVLGFAVGRKWHRNDPESQVIVQVDTVVILDTIVREKPIYKTVQVIRHDTLRTEYWHLQHDTVVAQVPIEQKVYEEDSLYTAWVSGWHTSLDSLMIYQTTKEITVTKRLPAPKWSVGITAGPTMLLIPTGDIKFGMGVTAGLQYRF